MEWTVCLRRILPAVIPAAYLLLISVISVIVTVYDKWASKHRTDRRIRESSLLAFSIVGGLQGVSPAALLFFRKRSKKFF